LIKDFTKLPYDKKKQAIARKTPPFYTKSESYTRSQEIFFCDKCGDTSFELLENNKPTKKCCRCGAPYVSNK